MDMSPRSVWLAPIGLAAVPFVFPGVDPDFDAEIPPVLLPLHPYLEWLRRLLNPGDPYPPLPTEFKEGKIVGKCLPKRIEIRASQDKAIPLSPYVALKLKNGVTTVIKRNALGNEIGRVEDSHAPLATLGSQKLKLSAHFSFQVVTTLTEDMSPLNWNLCDYEQWVRATSYTPSNG